MCQSQNLGRLDDHQRVWEIIHTEDKLVGVTGQIRSTLRGEGHKRLVAGASSTGQVAVQNLPWMVARKGLHTSHHDMMSEASFRDTCFPCSDSVMMSRQDARHVLVLKALLTHHAR